MKQSAMWNLSWQQFGRMALLLILVGSLACNQQATEFFDTAPSDNAPTDIPESDLPAPDVPSQENVADSGDGVPNANVLLGEIPASMEIDCPTSAPNQRCEGRYIFEDKEDDYVVHFFVEVGVDSSWENEEEPGPVTKIYGSYWDQYGDEPAGLKVDFEIQLAAERTETDSGTLTIDEEIINSHVNLNEKGLAKVQAISAGRFGVALSQIPLELGCLASADPNTNLIGQTSRWAGLLLPWQMALKNLSWDEGVRSPTTANSHLPKATESSSEGGGSSAGGTAHTCTYFAPEINTTDPEGNLSWPEWQHPVALAFSHVHPMPMAIGIFPFAMPTEEQLNGFNEGMGVVVQSNEDAAYLEDCSGACGQGCHNNNCTIRMENICGDTAGEFKQVITVSCQTHTLCQNSDSCIGSCNIAAAGLADDAMHGVQSFAASGCRARCVKQACFGANSPGSVAECTRLLFGGSGVNDSAGLTETLTEFSETVTYASSQTPGFGADGGEGDSQSTLPEGLVKACCAQCDDGFSCTLDCNEDSGSCLSTTDPDRLQDSLCDGNDNPCTKRVCKGTQGAGLSSDGCHVDFLDGASCAGDTNLCTLDETCAAGVCGCDEGNLDNCPSDNFVPKPCPDDPDPCSTNICLADTGECQWEMLDDGPCDDGNICTEADECSAGACVGEDNECDDFKECTSDSCQDIVGCRHTLEPGSCLIDDDCYWAVQSSPDSVCYICDPSISTDEWTFVYGCVE